MKASRPPSAPAVDPSRLSPLPSDFARFVHSLAKRAEPPFERRKSERIPISVPIPATPLDKDLLPIGKPFLAISRNISAGGISMVYLRPVRAEFLIITLDAEGPEARRLLTQLQRCRRIGCFYELSGKFVARFND